MISGLDTTKIPAEQVCTEIQNREYNKDSTLPTATTECRKTVVCSSNFFSFDCI